TGLHEAGPRRDAIKEYGARAALPDAAAILCAGQTDRIAEHPQQRRLRFRVHGILDAIDEKSERHIGTSLSVRNPTACRTCLMLQGGLSSSANCVKRPLETGVVGSAETFRRADHHKAERCS